VDNNVLVTGLTWNGTKGRKTDGTCATKSANKCTNGADGVDTAVATDKAITAAGTCQTITATRCWDGSDTPATETKVIDTRDYNCVDLVNGQCWESDNTKNTTVT
jgi:hypothetical protein